MLNHLFMQAKVFFRSLGVSEEGQGLIEYALIVVLIAVVVIGVLTLLGTEVDNVFNDILAGLRGEGAPE